MGLPKYAVRPLRKTAESGERERVGERRALTRLEVQVPVLLLWDGIPRSALVTDLGIGGLFVECEEHAAFNTSVCVVIEWPSGPLRLPGIVRWHNDHGMGVQLGLLGARETHAIAEMLAKARQSLYGKP
jgi:type IV pilus assembly protein PilZ